jgi:hypothetical protein
VRLPSHLKVWMNRCRGDGLLSSSERAAVAARFLIAAKIITAPFV